MNAVVAEHEYTPPVLTEVEEAQSQYSDFHKDRYGFRPRFMSDAQWNSLEWLKGAIKGLHDDMDRMKATFAGRESLREEGWHVPETEPELIKHALWLQQERTREHARRYAEWNTPSRRAT